MFLHRASAMSFQHSSFPGLKSIWKGNQSRLKLSWNFFVSHGRLGWPLSGIFCTAPEVTVLKDFPQGFFSVNVNAGTDHSTLFLWLPGSPECRVKLMVQGWQLHQCTEAERDFSPLAALSPLISFFPCSEFSLFLCICHVIVSLNVSLYETWVTSILSISSVSKLWVFICV